MHDQEPDRSGQETHNEVSASTVGALVQAGSVTGGVHLHQHAVPERVVPRQLPAPPHLFIGRDAELTRLDEVLGANDPLGATTMPIFAIGGTGGVGKTWLALHWAHRHLDLFPDGQLFVDLRGFSVDGRPMSATVAMRGLLDALGVNHAQIPADPHAQAAHYRSLVAGKRMMIVLDNAVDTTQVTPLLPGTTTCIVLITSRDRLTGLIASHSARSLQLDVLSEPKAEGRALLTARLGSDRLATEPAAVDELLAYCGGFPLALSIVAAHAEAHPDFPLADLAAEISDSTIRLAMLDNKDPAASLPAVLSWSYSALTIEQAQAFGLIGISPGPDIGLLAVANLADISTPEARVLLHELEQTNLVQQHAPGRYRMHDLIKLYAQVQAQRDLSEVIRAVGLRRLVDFLVHTAYSADRLLAPHRDPIQVTEGSPSREPQSIDDEGGALTWFAAEHRNLLAAQQTAVGKGWHTQVWQLAWALDTFHSRRGYIQESASAWRAGLTAAEQLADPALRILAQRRLAMACVRLGRHDDAMKHLQEALQLAIQTKDLPCEAGIHCDLAGTFEQTGDYPQALVHATRALEQYRSLRTPVREAETLNLIGWYQAQIGDFDQAHEHCEIALTLARSHDHRNLEGAALDSLGYIAQRTGQYTESLQYYRQALALFRHLGHSFAEADTLVHLGHSHVALGERELARTTWQEALDLYRSQGYSNAVSRIEEQLSTLDVQT